MKYYFFDEVLSTNSNARDLLSVGNNVTEPFCIITDFQTSGKGQGRNKWISDKGSNLLFSYVVFPTFLQADQNFLLSQITALSILDILNDKLSGVSIKWPNDVLVGSKKIAGILIENSIMGNSITHSIIGVGINVNQKEFPDFSPEATSLLIETNIKHERSSLIDQFEHSFLSWFQLLEEGNRDKIVAQYHQRLIGFKEWIDYRRKSGHKIFKGKLIGIEEDGRLILKDKKNHVHRYGFREVEMIFNDEG